MSQSTESRVEREAVNLPAALDFCLPPPYPRKANPYMQIPLQNNESIEGTWGKSEACAVLKRPLVAKYGPAVCPLSLSSPSSQGASPRPAYPYPLHHDLPSRTLGSAPAVSISPALAGTQCLNPDVSQFLLVLPYNTSSTIFPF